jgi:hypothetical protein
VGTHARYPVSGSEGACVFREPYSARWVKTSGRCSSHDERGFVSTRDSGACGRRIRDPASSNSLWAQDATVGRGDACCEFCILARVSLR